MNKKGFTLIELLVVIAIIGLLSTLAVVALGSARSKARDAKRLSDLRAVQNGLEMYYAEKAAYPTAASGVTLGSTNAACLNAAAGFTTAGCTSAFLTPVPADPGSNSYVYTSADGTTYSIVATLETTMNNYSQGITASPSGIAD
jgi:type II secretion system protein G